MKKLSELPDLLKVAFEVMTETSLMYAQARDRERSARRSDEEAALLLEAAQSAMREFSGLTRTSVVAWAQSLGLL